MSVMTMSAPHTTPSMQWSSLLTPSTSSLPPLSLSLFPRTTHSQISSKVSSTNSSYIGANAACSRPQTSTPNISEIIPRLYISDLSTAESEPVLSALGVTHVLTAMRGTVVLPTHAPLTHHHLPLDDLPFSELAAHLPSACAFISDALSASPDNRIVVHCAEGISRSVSVVAAYLIVRYGWDVRSAVGYIKARRWVADPNGGFLQQLREWEDAVKAGGVMC